MLWRASTAVSNDKPGISILIPEVATEPGQVQSVAKGRCIHSSLAVAGGACVRPLDSERRAASKQRPAASNQW